MNKEGRWPRTVQVDSDEQQYNHAANTELQIETCLSDNRYSLERLYIRYTPAIVYNAAASVEASTSVRSFPTPTVIDSRAFGVSYST